MTTTLVNNKECVGSVPPVRADGGFSLLELVIAMAIFLIISGVSFSLFNQQQASTKLLQGQTALNIALRNAVAQLQMDLVAGGSGYFQGMNMPSWPVGVTIVNNMSTTNTSCYNSTTNTYGVSCFDRFNIIVAANQTIYPAIHATDNTGGTSGTSNCSTTSIGTAYGQAAVLNGTTWTLANTALEFRSGDQLLFITNSGAKITTAMLTSNATVSGSAVKFTFNATNADGSNSLANDPLDITACDGQANCASNNKLGNQFCGKDWIIKLAPITYQVCSGPGSPAGCDQSSTSPDIQDPKLVRKQSGNQYVVMEQVIGFRVGATLWNGGGASESSSTDSVTTSYNYLASTYTVGTMSSPWNFSLIRSVRASLIGRTVPSNSDSEFRNAFDQGRYQVQGVAVVVNPRNMSMNDN
jgi:prepilin-type N-terminal cleavage/methylation domain-containing protein